MSFEYQIFPVDHTPDVICVFREFVYPLHSCPAVCDHAVEVCHYLGPACRRKFGKLNIIADIGVQLLIIWTVFSRISNDFFRRYSCNSRSFSSGSLSLPRVFIIVPIRLIVSPLCCLHKPPALYKSKRSGFCFRSSDEDHIIFL